jgi:hypothetical protein
MVVFPRFDGGNCEFVTHVSMPLSAGVTPAWLRDYAAGKMDDVLAVKVWLAEVSLALRERLHELTGLVDPGSPPPVGASEQDLAADWSEEERYQEERRHSCAAIGFMPSGRVSTRRCTGTCRPRSECSLPPMAFAQSSSW